MVCGSQSLSSLRTVYSSYYALALSLTLLPKRIHSAARLDMSNETFFEKNLAVSVVYLPISTEKMASTVMLFIS